MFANFQQFLTELEINIKFPTCWDGVNVEDINGNHVTYSEECDGDVFNECFDFDCPESHPVRMPEIHLYVRVLNYEGGAHVFSNDTDVSPQLDFLQYLSFLSRSSTATTSLAGMTRCCSIFLTSAKTTQRWITTIIQFDNELLTGS